MCSRQLETSTDSRALESVAPNQERASPQALVRPARSTVMQCISRLIAGATLELERALHRWRDLKKRLEHETSDRIGNMTNEETGKDPFVTSTGRWIESMGLRRLCIQVLFANRPGATSGRSPVRAHDRVRCIGTGQSSGPCEHAAPYAPRYLGQ